MRITGVEYFDLEFLKTNFKRPFLVYNRVMSGIEFGP
ncbi:MAG: hypothetical protein HW419_3428 [Deltaproteobacteria bacterium]|nr:hypothetical protein [Deltaproteobacteria bacterium]